MAGDWRSIERDCSRSRHPGPDREDTVKTAATAADSAVGFFVLNFHPFLLQITLISRDAQQSPHLRFSTIDTPIPWIRTTVCASFCHFPWLPLDSSSKNCNWDSLLRHDNWLCRGFCQAIESLSSGIQPGGDRPSTRLHRPPPTPPCIQYIPSFVHLKL
jgi:hypothetical protein